MRRRPFGTCKFQGGEKTDLDTAAALGDTLAAALVFASSIRLLSPATTFARHTNVVGGIRQLAAPRSPHEPAS
jgi:hypothetical protein